VNVQFSGYTARTHLGTVDMVPFLRRMNGHRNEPILPDERDAGIFALRATGVEAWRIAGFLDMSVDAVEGVLNSDTRSRPVGARTAGTIRQRRMAERVLIEGRWVHPGAPHGTSSGYDHWWCRCVPCAAARAVRAAAQRRKAAERKEAARGDHRPAVA
jgi:hypothetical protein